MRGRSELRGCVCRDAGDAVKQRTREAAPAPATGADSQRSSEPAALMNTGSGSLIVLFSFLLFLVGGGGR